MESDSMLNNENAIDKSRIKDDLKGYKILLIEDTLDARTLIGRILSNAGGNVFSVANVKEARSLLNEFRPDVIISDIGMPEEDGISFIKSLRDDERFQGQHIPAIALTAYITSDYKHLTLKAGFEAHLCKPISASSLVETVVDVFHAKTGYLAVL